MAKEIKNVNVQIKEDGAEVSYCVCDGDLSKKVRKEVTLSAGDQVKADAIAAAVKAQCESDEGV